MLAGCLAALLTVGGCGDSDAPVTATADLPSTSSQSAADSGPTIPPLADEGFEATPSETANAAPGAPTSSPASVPAIEVPAIASLTGWTEGRVVGLLGAPHFRRIDAPAELWQYRLNGCVLDLFLYPSSAGAMSVDHLETRVLDSAAAGSANDPQSCFAAIVQAAAGATS